MGIQTLGNTKGFRRWGQKMFNSILLLISLFLPPPQIPFSILWNAFSKNNVLRDAHENTAEL